MSELVAGDVDEEVDVELVGDDLYEVLFTVKPFGVSFGKNEQDKRNLFVTKNDPNATGYQESVIVNSYIAKLDKEVVEGLGAKKIFKIFKNKYADCPLKITFRKPNEEQMIHNEAKEEEEDGTPPAPEAPADNLEDPEYEYFDENDPNYEYYEDEEQADAN